MTGPLGKKTMGAVGHAGLVAPTLWQGLVFFREEDNHLRELLARWAMAFPRVLMCHLREDMDVAKEVAVRRRCTAACSAGWLIRPAQC
jgi:hypothetical protein